MRSLKPTIKLPIWALWEMTILRTNEADGFCQFVDRTGQSSMELAVSMKVSGCGKGSLSLWGSLEHKDVSVKQVQTDDLKWEDGGWKCVLTHKNVRRCCFLNRSDRQVESLACFIRNANSVVESLGYSCHPFNSYFFPIKMSAGRLKRALNFRTCARVSFRCPASNMETALSDPN